MSKDDRVNRPRLSVDLTEEQQAVLTGLEWGIKGKLYRVLTDGLVELLQKYGTVVLGAIMNNDVSALDVLRTGLRKKEARDDA